MANRQQMTFEYKPLVFQEPESKECRITRAHFARRMDLEGNVAVIKKAIITPFEEAFLSSGLEELACPDFTLARKLSKKSASTRWKEIYNVLNAFLEVRADDSRAASHKDVEYLEGIGYCIAVQALQTQIQKFKEENTTPASESISIEWPSKKRTEDYPTRLVVPGRDYRQVTAENAITILNAKRFTAGITPNYLTPFKNELIRWFTANTGYDAKDRIPDEQAGFVERTIELAPGSYIQIQLIPEDTPEYQEAVESITTHLQDIENNSPVQALKHTLGKKGHYVCIKSVYESIQMPALQEQRLVKRTARWDIAP
jgi:hypothetical protein